MARPKGLVSFTSLADVPCYYARVNEAYGNLAKAAATRKRWLHPSFLKKLQAMVLELKWLTNPYQGLLTAIVSGGAYVNKPGPHGVGKGYDIGGLIWTHGNLVWHEVAEAYHDGERRSPQQYLYLAVESIMRRHFGTCLGIRYNEAHHNHEHLQVWHAGNEVEYWDKGFGSTTRTSHMRAVLEVVWDVEFGSTKAQLRAAVVKIRKRLSLGPLSNTEEYQKFLLVTAMAALEHS